MGGNKGVSENFCMFVYLNVCVFIACTIRLILKNKDICVCVCVCVSVCTSVYVYTIKYEHFQVTFARMYVSLSLFVTCSSHSSFVSED